MPSSGKALVQHPRLQQAATVPVGRILLALMGLEWVLIAGFTLTGHLIGDAAWFLAALTVTSTLFFLTAYDAVIEAIHIATGAADGEVPERFAPPPSVVELPLVKWARTRQKHLAWLLFGAGIIAGHLWWH
jgi:hypothetical protein